jgi:putative addiction module component (TIGR02574 family)
MSIETAAPTQLERLMMEIIGLPTATRARLAEQLIKSLEHEEYPPQEEVDRRWQETIKRRVAEIDEGKAVLVPGDEVLKRLREKFA